MYNLQIKKISLLLLLLDVFDVFNVLALLLGNDMRPLSGFGQHVKLLTFLKHTACSLQNTVSTGHPSCARMKPILPLVV